MIYENIVYAKERSLYNIKKSQVINCTFEGKEDGESPLKECKDILVKDSLLNLRYPFWHNDNTTIDNCKMLTNCRAPLWYCNNVNIINTSCLGVKAVRECKEITVESSNFESEEFGWKSNKLTLKNSSFVGHYFLFDSKNIKMENCTLKGKYSFQYMDNVRIENSNLDTKDAFWHSKNVVVIDSILKGEYIGWYSDNVTLINCIIEGTQPFCYCKKLKLINCQLKNADLCFENSEVNATIIGSVESIKNPLKGKIFVDEVKDIILEDYINEPKAKIIVKNK